MWRDGRTACDSAQHGPWLCALEIVTRAVPTRHRRGATISVLVLSCVPTLSPGYATTLVWYLSHLSPNAARRHRCEMHTRSGRWATTWCDEGENRTMRASTKCGHRQRRPWSVVGVQGRRVGAHGLTYGSRGPAVVVTLSKNCANSTLCCRSVGIAAETTETRRVEMRQF